jgi:hypothetical protein
VEQLVEHALFEGSPALGAVPSRAQLLHQLGAEPICKKTAEDVADQFRLGLIDHEPAITHIEGGRHMAAHLHSALTRL